MKKFRKLLKSPVKFFVDSRGVRKIINICVGYKDKQYPKPIALMFRFSPWKKFIDDFFSNYSLIYLDFKRDDNRNINHYRNVIEQFKNKTIFIWGYKEPQGTSEYCRINKIKLFRVEDGFLRSVHLGAEKSQPISLCIDSKGLYFDATKASDLEDILNKYDFKNDRELLEKARICKKLIIDLDLSKYNNVQKKTTEEIYGQKNRKRILVIGQVEDDASIQYGCLKKMTNNDLVMATVVENPDAEVIYKPHPDVLFGKRKAYSNPEDVKQFAKVIEEPLSLPDSFKTIDHVYTMTSLAGFEALMRGIPVTTFGCPFYSGWGLTIDKQPNERRKRKLTVDEVFAGAYILYAKYYSLVTREEINLQEAIEQLSNLKKSFHNSILNDVKKYEEKRSIEYANKKELEERQKKVFDLKERKMSLKLRLKELEVQEMEMEVKKKVSKLERKRITMK